MAREVRHFDVSVPAGTAIATPQTTNLTMPARIVRRVTVRIPPGPSGLVGFQLAASGVAFIPYNAGKWLVADDATIALDLTDAIDSGAWQLIAYNTGAFPHTLYVTFELDLVQDGPGLGLLTQTIPLDQLNP